MAAAADLSIDESRDLVPMYRFWSPVSGKHFYTIDAAERDMLINEYAYFWNYEGIAYYVYASNSESGLMPVYRFWSPVTVGHFYTISEDRAGHADQTNTPMSGRPRGPLSTPTPKVGSPAGPTRCIGSGRR